MSPKVSSLPVPLPSGSVRPKTVQVYEDKTEVVCRNIHFVQRNVVFNNPEAIRMMDQAALYLQDIMTQLGLPWESPSKMP